MAVCEIRLYPDPVLKQVCDPLEKLDTKADALVQDRVLVQGLAVAGPLALPRPGVVEHVR